MVNLSRREWIFLICIFFFSFIPTFGGLLRVVELGGGAVIFPENPRALTSPVPVVLHIVSSFIFCIVGALQFLPSLRRHRPAMHRTMGRTIAITGCISALTGIWMTHFFAFPDGLQGSLLYWARIVLGLAMIGLIGRALFAIRFQNIAQHGASMIRAYAIGQGASTQSILGIAWILLSGTEPLGPFRDGLMVFAWMLNLLAAEYLIDKVIAARGRPSLGGPV